MPSLNHGRSIPAKGVCDDDGDYWTKMDSPAGSSNRCRTTNPTTTNPATSNTTTRHRPWSRLRRVGGTSCIGVDPAVANLTSPLDVCSFFNSAAPLPRELSRTRTTAQSTCSIYRSTSGNCPSATSLAMVWHASLKRAATNRDRPPWRSDRRGAPERRRGVSTATIGGRGLFVIRTCPRSRWSGRRSLRRSCGGNDARHRRC